MDTVEVDGSSGEGGGSILRLSAALGVIFKKRVHITNIRAKRDNPGLRAQHLVGLEALTTLTRGTLEGGKIGSTEILFEPGTVQPGVYTITIGTAGSIGLVYQVLSIACARNAAGKDKRIDVHVSGGGTFGKWAPASSYIMHVLIPLLERAGFTSSLVIERHGFFPKGGASARITFGGSPELRGLVLDARGNIQSVEGESVATTHLRGARVAERQAKSCSDAIRQQLGLKDVNINTSYVDALNPGSGITTWVKTTRGCIISSGSVIGEKGVPAEKVGLDCAADMIRMVKDSPATVDEYTSDQILPFMMLSNERSVIIAPSLTGHAKTNLDMMAMFTSRPWSCTEREDHVVIEFPLE